MMPKRGAFALGLTAVALVLLLNFQTPAAVTGRADGGGASRAPYDEHGREWRPAARTARSAGAGPTAAPGPAATATGPAGTPAAPGVGRPPPAHAR